MTWSFSLSKLVCDRMAPSSPQARRPGAGAVPGRRGACLAVRTPPAAFVDSLAAARLRRLRACHTLLLHLGLAAQDPKQDSLAPRQPLPGISRVGSGLLGTVHPLHGFV